MSIYQIGSSMTRLVIFGFFPVMAFAIYLRYKTRQMENARQKKRYTMAFAALVLTIVLLANIGGYLSQRGARNDFNLSLLNCSQASFQRASGPAVVIEGESLAEFKQWMSVPGVMAHHSHPTSRIWFSLSGDPSVYLLSRDSDVPDEYWLSLSKDRWGRHGPTVKQIRSSELSAWLKRQNL